MRLSKGILLIALLVGCASYQARVREARDSLSMGSPEVAAEMFAERANQEGKDQLLYMLDYGIALHEAGELEKSNKDLIEAAQLADVKDYTSLTREAGYLFLNESLIPYKSERC